MRLLFSCRWDRFAVGLLMSWRETKVVSLSLGPLELTLVKWELAK